MEREKNVGGLKKREMRNKIIGFDFCVSHEKEKSFFSFLAPVLFPFCRKSSNLHKSHLPKSLPCNFLSSPLSSCSVPRALGRLEREGKFLDQESGEAQFLSQSPPKTFFLLCAAENRGRRGGIWAFFSFHVTADVIFSVFPCD